MTRPQIDAIAPCRGNDTTSERTFDRILSAILVEMDGISKKSIDSQSVLNTVIVVATCTQRKSLDPALLRPGRFDIQIALPLPNEQAREDFLKHRLSKISISLEPQIGCDIAIESLDATQIEKLSRYVASTTAGASIVALDGLCREACMKALRSSEFPLDKKMFVSISHFADLLQNFDQPSKKTKHDHLQSMILALQN